MSSPDRGPDGQACHVPATETESQANILKETSRNPRIKSCHTGLKNTLNRNNVHSR